MFFKIVFTLLFPLYIFATQADCKVYFSPSDHLADRLIEQIDKEQKNIKVAIYSMKHLGISKALARAKERGVAIEMIVDPSTIGTHPSMQGIEKAQIPLFVWDGHAPGRSKPLMHDKFCIFGDHSVWTGSFNFTQAADMQHQENAVMIEGKEVAQTYLSQFSKMKLSESYPLQEYLTKHPKKVRAKK